VDQNHADYLRRPRFFPVNGFSMRKQSKLKYKYHRLIIDGASLAEIIKSTDDLNEWFSKEYHFGKKKEKYLCSEQ
jgi:hypothetical protein